MESVLNVHRVNFSLIHSDSEMRVRKAEQRALSAEEALQAALEKIQDLERQLEGQSGTLTLRRQILRTQKTLLFTEKWQRKHWQAAFMCVSEKSKMAPPPSPSAAKQDSSKKEQKKQWSAFSWLKCFSFLLYCI